MPHLHDKIDFTAEVFIVHDRRVLLRKHDKYGLWLSVGGHIELHEDPNEAAVREVREEVGLDVTLIGEDAVTGEGEVNSDTYRELVPPRFLNRHRISDTHEHLALTFFAHLAPQQALTPAEEIKSPAGERSDGLSWFSEQELNSLEITERVRRYAKAALRSVGGA